MSDWDKVFIIYAACQFCSLVGYFHGRRTMRDEVEKKTLA